MLSFLPPKITAGDLHGLSQILKLVICVRVMPGISVLLSAVIIHVNLWRCAYLIQVYFAAFRSIEEDPDRKIIGEIFKTMFDARGCKQDIVGHEGLASGATNKISAALGDDIDL